MTEASAVFLWVDGFWGISKLWLNFYFSLSAERSIFIEVNGEMKSSH